MSDENCPACVQNGAPQQRSEEPEPLMEEPTLRDPMTTEKLRELANLEREEQQRIMQNRLALQEDGGSASVPEGSTLQSAYNGVIDIPPFKYPPPDDILRHRKMSEKGDAVAMDVSEAELTNKAKKLERKGVGRKVD
jgi:hypothetical protein